MFDVVMLIDLWPEHDLKKHSDKMLSEVIFVFIPSHFILYLNMV